MRSIRPRDFWTVAGALGGCLAFFGLVIAMEWHRAEFWSKVIVMALFGFFLLLAIRALTIYRPQEIEVGSLKIVRGPCWSMTVLTIRFVWVEIERDGVRRRIRLVQ